MKLSKITVTSFFLTIMIPIIGVIHSFFNIKKNNIKSIIKILSLFVFFFVITIPPFQDLYRRYFDSYVLYNSDTTYFEAFKGHFDFIFYGVSLFFKKNGIPFFYISSIFASLSVYLTLMALYDLQANNKDDNLSSRTIRVSYFSLFCFINIIIIALGLRFGLAVALTLRACTIGLARSKNISSYLLFILSCLTHFSMVFVLMVYLLSKVVRVKNFMVIPLSVICAVFGGAILPFILARFNILGISEYVTTGYVDGGLAESSTNTNAIIITSYNYVLILIFGYLHLTRPTWNKRFCNFINVFYVSTFVIIISFTAFNRYFVGVGTFLLLLRVLSDSSFKSFATRKLIIGLALFNLLFSNVYIQRRPIMLAHMWNGFYTPSILRLSYNMNDFNDYLKHINSDGDWIGHEIRQ